MTTSDDVLVDRAERDVALLDLLSTALSSLNISATIIKVILLNMRAGNPVYLHHMPPALEVRGRNREFRAKVEIVDGDDGRAYAVHSAGRSDDPRFPVGAHEEAAIYLHSVVRGWRAL
ncbi:hypothetical protein [Nonomuraea sp. 10N515B]|uniref:hypothetical protein n=1 Tax=Nonomuraea sp. 10N515B TaxID=3457422 RepID=UPI003FCEC042